MPIKVNISLGTGGRFKPVSSHTLHEKRITIGRDKECTLTLEDTQKHVSRMHAEIEESDGSYWLKVVSKVNPVIVNGKRYAYDNRLPLLEGDQVTVGLYRLDVVSAEVAPPAPKSEPKRAVEQPEDITYVARPGALSGLAGLKREAPAAPVAPAAPIKEEAKLAPPPRPAPAAPPPPQAPAPPPRVVAPLIETASEEATYVPPATAAPPQAPAPRTPPPHFLLPESSPSDDEVTYIPPVSARGGRPSPDITQENFSEDLTSISRPPPRAPTEPVTPAAPQPPQPVKEDASPAASSDDLDLDLSDAFADSEEQTAVPRPAVPAQQPEIEEGFSEDLTYVRPLPPRPAAKEAPPSPPAATAEADRLAEEETQYRPSVQKAAPVPTVSPVPTASAVPLGADRTVHAFLEGAGLSHLKVPNPESFMRETGVMVRAAIEGVMMLLLAREEAQKQLGAVPEHSPEDSPLKSMADPAEVIAFLFDPKRPAIAAADPVQAIGEACTDLRAHQVALMAAMRAGIAGAVASLDPKKIEREHGVNLGGLNLTRKSKLWDISVAQHEKLSREIAENAGKAFAADILAAYAAHLHKVRGGR